MARLAKGRTLAECLAAGMHVEVSEVGPDWAPNAGPGEKYYAQLIDPLSHEHGEYAFAADYVAALESLDAALKESV